MMARTQITRDDIIPMADYAKTRGERRKAVTEIKKNRRLAVGPYATFYFENFDTMWHQIHEMLFIEKGGEAQIADELSAYNPLIPKGRELVATVMIEIPDERRRREVLARLGGLENTMSIMVADKRIAGVPEADVDRTTASGKASSVQFVHFPFSADAVEAFKTPGTRVTVAIEHPDYAHIAVMPEAARAALAGDFT
jgi:Protein of unknown function (DUF3501)